MRGAGFVWTEERVRKGWELAYAQGSITPAARELGVSDAALRAALQERRIKWRLPPPDAPASAGASVLTGSEPPKIAVPDSTGSGRPETARPIPLELPALDWRGARPLSPPGGVERRVNVGDLHIPAHLAQALSCTYAIIRLLQPHKVFQLGDLLNAQAFSHHAPRSPHRERLDMATMAARGFVRAVKTASPGSEIVIVKGNHDGWADRWEAENPAFEGYFRFERMLGLENTPDDDRPPMFEGVRVVRHSEKSGYVDGPIAYVHGTGGGMYPARRYAENVGPRAGVKHIRFAHHHTNQVFSHKNGILGRCVGWLGNEDDESNAFDYASPPRGWWVGLTVDDVAGEHVTTTEVEIKNGVAFFGGRLISGVAA